MKSIEHGGFQGPLMGSGVVNIQDLIEATIRPGTLVLTDEYTIYRRLPDWGFEHQTVCHNAGEDARDERW